MTARHRDAGGAGEGPDHGAPERRKSRSRMWIEEAMGMNAAESRPPSRKWWPMTAAAVGVLVLRRRRRARARRYLAPPRRPSPTEGTLIVTTNPAGAQLFVDGVERGVTPLTVARQARAALARAARQRRPAADADHDRRRRAGRRSTSSCRPRHRPSASFGSAPNRQARASASTASRAASRRSTVADLPPGEHAVVLESDLGSIKQIVTIEAGNTASLMVPMAAPEGAPVSGWMAVSVAGGRAAVRRRPAARHQPERSAHGLGGAPRDRDRQRCSSAIA